MRPGISHLDGTVHLLLRLDRRRFSLRMDRRSQRPDSRPDTVQQRWTFRLDRYRERKHLLVIRRLQVPHWYGIRQLHQYPVDRR